MAKITKDTAAQVETMDGFEGRYGETDGYVIGFETYTADADPAELFRGLPDDRCQCPHWGVVLRGALIYRNADGTEDRIAAGEAYYVGPGHLPQFTAGTAIVDAWRDGAETCVLMRDVSVYIPGWERLLDRLGLLTGLLELGWNKALDAAEHPDPAKRDRERADLAWWLDAATPALAELGLLP